MLQGIPLTKDVAVVARLPTDDVLLLCPHFWKQRIISRPAHELTLLAACSCWACQNIQMAGNCKAWRVSWASRSPKPLVLSLLIFRAA